jgi:tetratricopeptide (TPR) repeat protein
LTLAWLKLIDLDDRVTISLEQELARWNEVIQNHPLNPKAYIRRGMVNFKLALVNQSIQDFDQAEKLDPTLSPYLWQRGLSYYYAERFEEGAAQFELDLTVNAQDVEETVWRYLCIAGNSCVTQARQELLSVRNDPRPLMGGIYELFAGNCTPDDVLRLGDKDGKRGKFYSHLYIGLYYEAAANLEPARSYILTAVNKYKIDDYMWYLAYVHQKLRGWD